MFEIRLGLAVFGTAAGQQRKFLRLVWEAAVSEAAPQQQGEVLRLRGVQELGVHRWTFSVGLGVCEPCACGAQVQSLQELGVWNLASTGSEFSGARSLLVDLLFMFWSGAG